MATLVRLDPGIRPKPSQPTVCQLASEPTRAVLAADLCRPAGCASETHFLGAEVLPSWWPASAARSRVSVSRKTSGPGDAVIIPASTPDAVHSTHLHWNNSRADGAKGSFGPGPVPIALPCSLFFPFPRLRRQRSMSFSPLPWQTSSPALQCTLLYASAFVFVPSMRC